MSESHAPDPDIKVHSGSKTPRGAGLRGGFGKRTLFKPTRDHERLIILAADVNYHLVRYVRARTIKSVIHPGQPLHKTKAVDALSTTIRQTKALLDQLMEEIP